MDVHGVVAAGAVRTYFQPIVDLDLGTVVAYEALSRGPVGPLEFPDRLFAAAREQGVLSELDAVCRKTALTSAVQAGLAAPLALFVNVEPEVLDEAPLDELIDIAQRAPRELSVVLEITERAIGARPAELLACVRKLRQAGWRIALDDVGADDLSLAFMPLLRPDVVKLDLRLVQERPGPAVAKIMNAVNAYAQRTGATVLAEGIEDERHLEIARALGATLGQGYLFGRPAPRLDTELPTGGLELPVRDWPQSPTSPFGCLPAGTPLRRSTKPLLVELSKHLEREALAHGSTCLVVSTFQYAKHFTVPTAERYRELADTIGFVAAIGQGLPVEPVAGVRGADLAGADPLSNEWDLVVLAPHFAAALLARDLGDVGRDARRRFEFALSYDRDVVSAAAEALLARVAPSSAAALVAQPGEPAPQVAAPSSGSERRRDWALTLHGALAATTNGISIADVTRPDHPLVYVNPAFERLSGLRADEVLGTNCRILQGPGTDPEAVARIRRAIAAGEECKVTILNYRRGSDRPWWNEIKLSPIFDEDGRLVQYVGIQNDVSARVEAERDLAAERARSAAYLAEMERLAFRDSLTDLLNRRRLPELVTTAVAGSAETGHCVGLLYVDLDDFKSINDTDGHAQGDVTLAAVARHLRDQARPDDHVARIGGDEFVLVLTELDRSTATRHLTQVAQRIRCALAADPACRGLTVSIGHSIGPDEAESLDALLRLADRRMYEDKRRLRPVSGL
jgi:diguanylate cyclase (GGDEF)-like protein/PAS domain S-box-containing protein